MATAVKDHQMKVVRCSKCRRRFGTARIIGGVGTVVVDGIAPAGGFGAEFTGIAVSPEIRVNGGSARPRTSMSVQTLEDGRRRYRCNPRCGASWVVSEDQLLRAFLRATVAGRNELVFGDNV